MKYLLKIERLIRSPLTQYHAIMLQRLTATILQRSAFTLHEIYTNTLRVNKHSYIADKRICHMLKLADKFGSISDLLFIAICLYKTFRYREALSVIDDIKVKLAQPHLMYRGHVDPEKYTDAVGGASWSTKINQAIAHDIELHKLVCYIHKLTPERESLEKTNSILLCLRIPPLIMLHMIEFLCSRCVDLTRTQAALDNLQLLVHYDRGVFCTGRTRRYILEYLGNLSTNCRDERSCPLFLPPVT